MACSYRGYRLNDNLMSGGSPNEQGLKQDTQAALDHLLSRKDVDPQQVHWPLPSPHSIPIFESGLLELNPVQMTVI